MGTTYYHRTYLSKLTSTKLSIPATVLVTGCSQGSIGDAIAQEFRRHGHLVFAAGNDLTKMEHLKEMGLQVVHLDVTDQKSIDQAAEKVKAVAGENLQFLVNSAQIASPYPLLDANTAEARTVFDVNVFGLMAVIRVFAPFLITAKGTIINIGSVASELPITFQGYYNASKAAAKMLTDVLRTELSPFDIKVLSIITGGVKNNFFESVRIKELKKESRYRPATAEILWRVNGRDVARKGIEVLEVYARAVVKNALRRTPKNQMIIGQGTCFFWTTRTLMSRALQERVYRYHSNVRIGGIKRRIKRDALPTYIPTN